METSRSTFMKSTQNVTVIITWNYETYAHNFWENFPQLWEQFLQL